MKKILILLIVVILLSGGGFGAYYWFVLKDQQEVAAEPEPPPPPPPPQLVPIEPMTIPVIRQGSVRKYVLLKLTLQLVDQDFKDKAIVAMPRIKDQAFRDLHAFFAAVPVDNPISITAIKRRMRKVAAKNIGSEGVIDVLVEGIYEKRGGT